jgi:squalene-associated FAD-dependent desaturase
MTQHIAIIGAGYAGLTAGVCLAAQGYGVTVFEAGYKLGGRARAISYQQQILDNGQHICLGAYTDMLALLQQVGLEENQVFTRLPLELILLPHFHFTVPRLPTPWHLLVGLWQTTGLTWTERWQLTQLILYLKRCHYTLSYDQTAASWLVQHSQSANLINLFWQPLCLAALNTPLENASTQVLLQVLKESLGKPRAYSDLLLPKVDLSAAFPNAAARFIQQHHGQVKLGRRIRAITQRSVQWQIDESLFDQVVLAVAPHQLAQLVLPSPLLATASSLSQWAYHAIATVYLQYPAHITLPRPMQGIANGVSHWLFDRGQTHAQPGLIAVVISAMPQYTAHATLVQQIQQELRQFFSIQAAPIWYKVVIEKRATFSAVPHMHRPAQKTALAGLWLAGDYTIDHYPATLEGAVRSGKQVSQLITEQLHA